MGQTRVNLRHLLEDIRDAYPFPVHEAVVTELVANALDSGASEIRFSVAFDPPRLVCADNGSGMGRMALERYHDIAATSKQRGRGIGFAGVGAKLSLLLCREVLTETRTASFEGATRWWLESATLAPWEMVPAPGLLPFPTGTAVVLYLDGLDSELLDPKGLREILRDHYEALLDPDISRFLYLYYPGGVRLSVDGEILALEAPDPEEARVVGEVRKTRRRAVGAAVLRVLPEPPPAGRRGLAVSVLGKVVKRGWEWLGLAPEHPELVTGVVEVPELVALLTLNKSDFLRDAASLQKFYAIRKRIQESVSTLLAELGELPGRRPRARDLRPVEREVGRVLDSILSAFPELEPLLDRRRGWERVAGLVVGEEEGKGSAGDQVRTEQPALPGLEPVNLETEGEAPAATAEGGEAPPAGGGEEVSGRSTPARRRKPGLRLAWVEEPERRNELAWLEGSLLALNRAHPAVVRVRGAAAERLLVVTGIALALGSELEPGHDPARFISEFLARWGDRGAPGSRATAHGEV